VIISEGSVPVSISYPSIFPGTTLDLDVPGLLRINGEWAIRAELIPNSNTLMEQIQANSDPYQAWIGADGLKLPLTVRARLPGDRFNPLGMKDHSMKLSDFLVNVKLPKEARANWPLVCAVCEPAGEETILWVAGLRQSEAGRVSVGTRHTVWLSLERDGLATSG
jgi:tRNA(Ile)-lysidine synthase